MKTIAITGATGGVGFATAKLLAQKGHTLILMGRNVSKLEQSKNLIHKVVPGADLHSVNIDLESLESVKNAMEQLSNSFTQIDVLINNAGGIFNTKEITKDGLEKGFQVNHLGHFYLTLGLLHKIKKVINVSSEAHKMGKFEVGNLNGEKSFSGWKQYGATKMMNVLMAKGLRLKHPNVEAYSLHPGVVRTGFGANNSGWMFKLFSKLPFLKTPEEGAATSVYLAEMESPSKAIYFKDAKPSYAASAAISEENAQALWDASLKILEEKGISV